MSTKKTPAKFINPNGYAKYYHGLIDIDGNKWTFQHQFPIKVGDQVTLAKRINVSSYGYCWELYSYTIKKHSVYDCPQGLGNKKVVFPAK